VLVKDTTKDFACTYEDGTFYVKDVLIVIPKIEQPVVWNFSDGVITHPGIPI
jgi:hypothetical protein